MTAPCIRNRLLPGIRKLTAFTFSTALAAALPVAAFPALAQTLAPRLAQTAPGLNAPTPLWPPREAPKAAEPPPSVSAETAIGGIRIDELAPLAVGSDGIGTIDGLGPEMWRGTSRALITAYLPRLPLPSTSPAERALVRKLVLTSAVPPPAETSSAQAPAQGSESLLTLRFATLAAMGDADDFIALAKELPNANDEPSARARVEAALLAGDDATACASLGGAPRGASAGEFWTRAAVLCDVVGGRTEQAQLALDLLGEQGVSADSPFVALLRAALGDRKPIASLAGAGPIEVSLLRLSKAPLSPNALADASPLALRTIALGSGDIAARLDAAERAEALGAIPTGKLIDVYAAVPFKPDELGNALTVAGNDSSPRGRALFYKAEHQASGVSAAAAEGIAAALTSAREQGRFPQAARVYATDIAAIEPTPELQWFAEDAARALYAAGSVPQAEAWRAQTARTDGAGAGSLWPLATIAATTTAPPGTSGGTVTPTVTPTLDPNVAAVTGGFTTPTLAAPTPARPPLRQTRPFDAAGFNRWLGTLPENERLPKGALMLTLLDAMGAGVPPETWAPYLDAVGSGRSSPLLAPLSRAADGGRTGETVLLAIAVLGSGDPARWSPETVGAVGAALNRVGLGADAAALVLDAAVASGI